jgi:hypothetical protein
MPADLRDRLMVIGDEVGWSKGYLKYSQLRESSSDEVGGHIVGQIAH